MINCADPGWAERKALGRKGRHRVSESRERGRQMRVVVADCIRNRRKMPGLIRVYYLVHLLSALKISPRSRTIPPREGLSQRRGERLN